MTTTDSRGYNDNDNKNLFFLLPIRRRKRGDDRIVANASSSSFSNNNNNNNKEKFEWLKDMLDAVSEALDGPLKVSSFLLDEANGKSRRLGV